MQQEAANSNADSQQHNAMAAKMNRLEAALRLMNEERKNKVEDKETLLLKRYSLSCSFPLSNSSKLALFEQKFKDLEGQKVVSQSAQEADGMRDKVLLLEEKLRKMERRKSMSMTQMMQDKMIQMEKELAMVRNQGQSSKVAALEQEIHKLRNTTVTPSMVNDEETVALRNHIKKLEQGMIAAEKNMETQRLRLEQERMKAMQDRQREEQEFREAARKREQELLKRLHMIEQRVAQPGSGGGAPNPDIMKRLRQMEDRVSSGGSNPNMDKKVPDKVLSNCSTHLQMAEMEARLLETQKQLAEERAHTKAFLAAAPTEGPALEDWQNKMQIAWLQKANADLMAKLEASTKLIDQKMAQMQNMTFASGGVAKSGLTYAEINEKLAEIQKQLFDENTDERTSEQLNIEYEKLITELEATPEYQAEQLAIEEKWRAENEPVNR